MVNAGVRGTNIYKTPGFNVTFKYQSKFYWQSFLINGDVPAIFNADAMLQYSFPKPSLTVKIGGNNVLNQYYYSLPRGPQIGGFYYTTITYSL